MFVRARFRDKYPDVWPGNYRLGMWAWILQKVSGVAIILYAVVHFYGISTALIGVNGAGFDFFTRVGGLSAFATTIDFLTIAAIAYHAMNGFGLILMDLGIGVRSRKPIFWSLMVITLAIWVVTAWKLLPLITGQGLA